MVHISIVVVVMTIVMVRISIVVVRQLLWFVYDHCRGLYVHCRGSCVSCRYPSPPLMRGFLCVQPYTHLQARTYCKFREKNFKKIQLPNWPKKLQFATYSGIHPYTQQADPFLPSVCNINAHNENSVTVFRLQRPARLRLISPL